MIRTLLFVGGVGLIGYAIWSYVNKQKQLAEQFTYNIVSVNFGNISLDNVTANIVVRFTNIADIEALVNSFYVDIYVNNVKVGYAQDNGAFTLAAHSSTDVPVSVDFNPQTIFSNLTSLITASQSLNDVTIGAHGWAQVTSGIVQVTIPIDYDSTVKEIMS